MPVNSEHPQYTKNKESWELVRNCVKGSKKIKEEGTEYLPKPNPDDLSAENDSRYAAYKKRANFVNFTGFTKDGMLGMVFRRDIQTDFPTELEYLNDDATGGGITFDQLARSVTGNILESGRFGILADYPNAPAGVTKAQERVLNLRANMVPYAAENILNWQTKMIGGVKMLTLVVLYEPVLKPGSDGYAYEEKKQYRVLILEEGIYIQRLYDQDGAQIGDDIVPKANGKRLNQIPFVFIGSQNNDEVVDKAPLYDIAEINIGHYRNSADYEESCFMVGQPTPWAAGLSQGWVDTVMKGGVHIGSRAFVLLPEGGSAGLLQAAPNQMPQQAMKDKELQMIMIGARIIQDSNTNETREGAKIRFGGQTSKLATLVGNVEAGLTKAAEFIQMFMGGTQSLEIKMNREFYDATLDPQMVIAQIQLLDRGVITKSILRGDLRDGGMIDEDVTDEMIDDEAETDAYP